MTKQPFVTVLMNCYNSAKYLREAIDSVYAQTYGNWEIVFWDNASIDESAEIAQSYDNKLRYFKAEVNTPLYHARNLAVKEMKGDFLAILDCDDLWMPEKLEKQLKVFEENPKVGLVYTDLFYFNDKGIIKQLYKTRPFYRGEIFGELLKDYCISVETVMYSKEALAHKEIFNKTYNMIGDADLARRVAMDWQVEVIPEPLAKWRIHPESLTSRKPYLFAEETKILIEDYKQRFPNIERDYGAELAALQTEVDIVMGKSHWINGEMAKARRLFFKNIKNKKSFIFLILSIFPYTFAEKIIMKIQKVISLKKS